MKKRKGIIAGTILLGILIWIGAFFLGKTQRTSFNKGRVTSVHLSGENDIIIANQPPGDTVRTELALFSDPGFIAIYSDRDGEFGEELGRSDILTGERGHTLISLKRQSKNGEILYAILFSGNEPIRNESGDIVYSEFKVQRGLKLPI